MADYGFRTRNNGNEIQIDSTYSNMALVDKGVVTATQRWSHINFKQAIATTSKGRGLVAYRSSGAATLFGISPSGSGLSLNFLVYQPPSQAAVNVWWYLFDTPSAANIPAGQLYGMRVKNAQGVVTFDSRIDYMRMNSFWSGVETDIPSTSSGLAPVYSERGYPGILPAVIQGNMCNSQTEVPIGVGPGVEFMQFRFWQMFRQNGTAMGTTRTVEDYGPNTTPSNWPDIRRSNFGATIIDVSNL